MSSTVQGRNLSGGRTFDARIRQNPVVTDDRDPADDPAEDPAGGPPQTPWVIDATLGATAVAGRVAGGVASVVARSAPARALDGVARRVSRPLVQEGEAIRERAGSEGVPAAQDLVRRVTPDIVGAIDVDAILAAVDVQGLIDRVDIAGLIGRVDVAAIVDRVDIDPLLEGIDLDALLARIDLDLLLKRLDLNAVLAGVDLNALLAGIDLNALLAAVDLDALLAELDLNAVVDRLDVDALISNTEMGAVIVRSTGGVASEALDAVRSQGVSLDSVVARVANRVLRRDPIDIPAGPPLLVEQPPTHLSGDVEPGDADEPAGDAVREESPT